MSPNGDSAGELDWRTADGSDCIKRSVRLKGQCRTEPAENPGSAGMIIREERRKKRGTNDS